MSNMNLTVKNVPLDDVNIFKKNSKSKVSAKKIVDNVSIDYSWVKVFEDSIPYLDNIIRNPRRFIATEEDIVPIEKTKRVVEESVKHLAVHTNLIQDVDDDGVVKPIKLLNVFKEETIDLYENRFIYSLITNLYTFVNEQLTYQERSFDNKEEKVLNYEGDTVLDDHKVSIKVELKSNRIVNSDNSLEEFKKIKERINAILEVLGDYMSSKFMKAMKNATPVRSPIRKTNVILKEQNFIKALELWEFLENFQISTPVKEEHSEDNILSTSMVNTLDTTYFMDYCALSGAISEFGDSKTVETGNIVDIVLEYAKKYDVDTKLLKDKLDNVVTIADSYKKEQINGVNKCYTIFIDNHKSRFSKARMLFR